MTEAYWLTCNDPDTMLHFLAGQATNRRLRLYACACCRRIWPALTDPAHRRAAETAERRAQCALLRDIFGNPFRPVTVDPAWLRWHEETVPRLAQAIYDERRFNDLPILADALEEAGCTEADVLAHCRGKGEH